MSGPRVSVIVPAFNAQRFIAHALRSIERQGYEPLDIHVVDDGSTDATVGVVQRVAPGARCLSQPNAGPAAARNRGLAVATGDFIAFLDADDEWPDGKLARQIARLEADPSLDVVLGRAQYDATDGRSLSGIRLDAGSTLSNVHLGSGVFRRRAFDTVGLFDESLRFSEDHDWFLRARELGLRVLVLDEVTLRYRLHAGNMTRGKSVRDMSMGLVLKRSLDRRRQAGRDARTLDRWSSLTEATRSDT